MIKTTTFKPLMEKIQLVEYNEYKEYKTINLF